MFPAGRKTIKIILQQRKNGETHTEEMNAQKTEMSRKRTYLKEKAQKRQKLKRKRRT